MRADASASAYHEAHARASGSSAAETCSVAGNERMRTSFQHHADRDECYENPSLRKNEHTYVLLTYKLAQ